MSRRATRRANASRTRRRAAGLGVAVPAVVGVGALPAFATHSGADEGIDDDMDLLSEEEEDPDEFSEARLLDADDELNDGDLDDGKMVEDGYDPYDKDDEEDAEGAEGAEDEDDSEESATEEDEQDEAPEDGSDDEEEEEADDEERNRRP